uniref:Uncharacterized protein n=1 Tax=Rhizophora mucronata TaxID=61149 RepID=A0A2P2P365_RHIMU
MSDVCIMKNYSPEDFFRSSDLISFYIFHSTSPPFPQTKGCWCSTLLENSLTSDWLPLKIPRIVPFLRVELLCIAKRISVRARQ